MRSKGKTIKFTVEVKDINRRKRTDTTRFSVFAKDLQGAWKKALRLVDNENIIRIY